jgi:hypothetical protein
VGRRAAAAGTRQGVRDSSAASPMNSRPTALRIPWVSGTGAYMAVALLAGLSGNALLGLWWLDR